ncbi:hypothetical protein FALCPG4_012219 [Fusarium falciforme]
MNLVPFHLAFLAQLQKQGPKSTLSVEDSTRIYRKTARWLIETSDFSKLISEKEPRSLTSRQAREAGKPAESVDPSVLRFGLHFTKHYWLLPIRFISSRSAHHFQVFTHS